MSKKTFVMGNFAQMLLGLTLFHVFSTKSCVESQIASKPATDCYNTTTCPCCSVPCPSDGTGQCGSKCLDGYHGLKCYNLCPDNCIKCVDAAQRVGVSICTLCKDIYYSTASLYQCQSRCLNSCKTCELSAKNCTSCHDGYYLTNAQTCNICNLTCATCNSQTNCTSCKAGYYLNSTDASCYRCDQICYSCNTSLSCSCYNGCIEQNEVCNIDTNNCSYGCKPNFASSSAAATFRCDICIATNYGVECDLNCSANCKGGKCERLLGNCFDCEEGFYGDKCIMNCPTNCPYCNKTSGECGSCRDGFYGINCAQSCATDCKKCEQINGTCTSCKDDFMV